MSKITKKFQNNFTIVGNEFIKVLSMRDLAMYVYLLSLPNDWNLSIEGVCSTTSWGESQVRASMKSLELIGLLKRNKYKDDKGRWQWDYVLDNTITEKPHVENPQMENPHVEMPAVENPRIYKEIIINKQNKETILEDGYTDEQNKSTHHPRYSKLSDLDSNELKHELLERFNKRDQLQVISDLEDMKLWLESNGKRKKDYKAFAINWIKKNEAREKFTVKKATFNKYPIAGEVMGSI